MWASTEEDEPNSVASLVHSPAAVPRLHRHQYFVMAADGRVFFRPWIDYQKFPTGLCGSPGFEPVGMPIRAARAFAKLIRNG